MELANFVWCDRFMVIALWFVILPHFGGDLDEFRLVGAYFAAVTYVVMMLMEYIWIFYMHHTANVFLDAQE